MTDIPDEPLESISKAPPPRGLFAVTGAPTGILFILFCLIGTAAGVYLSALPVYRVLQARSWVPTPCEVASSRLIDAEDSSYTAIQYRYAVGGRSYSTDRYSGLEKDAPGNMMNRFPPGRTFTCYVNPNDPAQAMIDRSLTGAYFIGLAIFGLFTVAPLAILGGIHAILRRPPSSTSKVVPSIERVRAADARGPFVAKSASSPIGRLFGLIMFGLAWNSLIGLFTYFEIMGLPGEQPLTGVAFGCLAAILLPFQLIGVGLIAAIPYRMLALANPRPTITLSRRAVPVGGSVTLEWRLTGAVRRVKRLRLVLEGREEARFVRGTDTAIDSHVFYSEALDEVTDPVGMARGSTTIRIPADTMHTLLADHNKIIWTVKMHGDLDRSPDIDESFDISVTPR